MGLDKFNAVAIWEKMNIFAAFEICIFCPEIK